MLASVVKKIIYLQENKNVKVEMQDLFDEYLEYREINKLREIQRLTLELEEDEIAALMLKTAIKDEGVQKDIVSAWVELSSLGNGYLDKHLEKRLGVEPIARSASPQPPSFLSQSTPPEVRETKASSLYVTSKNVLYAEAGTKYTDELAVEAAAILMEKGYDKIELFKPRCLSEEEQGVFVAALRDELISRGFPAEKLTVPTIIEPQAEEKHESKYDNSNKKQFKKRNFKGKKSGGYSKNDPGHFDGQQEQYSPYDGDNGMDYGESGFDDNYANYANYDDGQYAEQPSYDEPPYYASEGMYGEPDSDMEQNHAPTSFPDNSSYDGFSDGFAEPESEDPTNASPSNEQSTSVASNGCEPPEPPPYDGEPMSGDYTPPEPPPYDGEPMSGDYTPPEPPPYDGEPMGGDYMPPEPPPYDGEPMGGDYTPPEPPEYAEGQEREFLPQKEPKGESDVSDFLGKVVDGVNRSVNESPNISSQSDKHNNVVSLDFDDEDDLGTSTPVNRRPSPPSV